MTIRGNIHRRRENRDMGSASSADVVIGHVQACTTNSLPLPKCGPACRFGTITLLIVLATLTLLALRTRPMVRLGTG